MIVSGHLDGGTARIYGHWIWIIFGSSLDDSPIERKPPNHMFTELPSHQPLAHRTRRSWAFADQASGVSEPTNPQDLHYPSGGFLSHGGTPSSHPFMAVS